ncbi:MAG: FtsX-like permease family protein [Oscillospiraceae bacterium]
MQKSKMVFVQIFMSAFTISIAFALNNGIMEKLNTLALQNEKIDFSTIYMVAVINFYIIAILFTCGVGILGALLSQIGKSQKSLALHIACGAASTDVFKLVVFEWTLRAAALPALLGILCASLVIAFAGETLSVLLFISLAFSPILLIETFVGVLAFCVLVSLYPAFKAMNTNVITALRA